VTLPDGGDAAGANPDDAGGNDASVADASDARVGSDAGGCSGMSSSTLDGVSLVFPAAPCRYTQTDVAAGIRIPYEVVVTKATAGLHPTPTDEGDCQRPGASGIIVGFAITGVGQNYCLCDLGLCPAAELSTAAVVGRHPAEIEWDGKNWRGPSDVPSPKGPTFPPDTYDVSVFAIGTRNDAGGGAPINFEVRATRTITITPDP